MKDDSTLASDVVIDRRKFLKVVGAGSCALVLGPTGCTIAEVFTDGDGVLAFDLTDPIFSGLNDVDGTAVVDSAGRKLILIRTDASTIVALNRICTHLNRDMDPAKSGNWDGERLHCRAHNSYFSSSGEKLEGPATSDLASYPVTFDAAAGTGTVTITGAPPENPVPEEYRGKTTNVPTEAENPAAYQEALAEGQRLWTDKDCSGCHGATGQGGFGTAFDGDTSVYTDDYLFWKIREGVEVDGTLKMPPYPENKLSDDEVWQVITYLRSLGQ